MISVIINTAAGAPHAKHVLSSGKVPYSWRAYALENWVIPHYIDDKDVGEIIVVGHWHEGDGYTYVPTKAVHHSWADCIAQRQAGYEAAKGDVLVFQHDDHVIRKHPRCDWLMGSDVVSPFRYTRLRGRVERLNDGSGDNYIDGHCAIYNRKVIEECQWKDVPIVFTMDVEHTKMIRAAGFTIYFSDGIQIWDVEYGATPWK